MLLLLATIGERSASAQEGESIAVYPAILPAEAGSYDVTIIGGGWVGAPEGLFISVCSGAEGGDSANIDASNALTACPTLVLDGGRGNPDGGGSFSYNLAVTVDNTAITNGQIAILAGELAAGSPWFAGTNLLVGSGGQGSQVLTSSVLLRNVTDANTENPEADQIIVGIHTINNCDAGVYGPSNNSYILDGGASAVTGVLAQNCNWEVTFLSGDNRCSVSAQVKGDASPNDEATTFDDDLGSAETDGSLVLAGVWSETSLQYSGGKVGSIEFTLSSNCSTNSSIIFYNKTFANQPNLVVSQVVVDIKTVNRCDPGEMTPVETGYIVKSYTIDTRSFELTGPLSLDCDWEIVFRSVWYRNKYNVSFNCSVNAQVRGVRNVSVGNTISLGNADSNAPLGDPVILSGDSSMMSLQYSGEDVRRIDFGATNNCSPGSSSRVTFINVTDTVNPTPVPKQVTVAIQPANNCDPGPWKPSSSSVTIGIRNYWQFGRLSSSCNWQVTFSSGDDQCAVNAELKGVTRFTNGASQRFDIPGTVTAGSLVLSGSGGASVLRYSGYEIAAIEFTVTNNCKTPSINLNNTTTPSQQNSAATQVVAEVYTSNFCSPVPGVSNYSELTLDAGGTASTGMLSSGCNWEITFRSGDRICAVSAQIKGDATPSDETTTTGDNLGSPETDGSLILSGVGGTSVLQYGGGEVASIEFAVTSDCTSTFSPTATATIASSVDAVEQAIYNGFQIRVDFTPQVGGCTQDMFLTLTFDDSGLATSTSADVALAGQPLGELEDCTYIPMFQYESGALRLNEETAVAQEHYDPSVRVSADTPATEAEYAPIAVEISVTSTFPTDEQFTAQDKVEYLIGSDTSCGNLSDVVSGQVFPGSIALYGSGLNSFSGNDRTYAIRAFADAQGDQPCSVTVTERIGPERCGATGGNEQSRTYSPGTSVFAFEFNHTCTPSQEAISRPESNVSPPARCEDETISASPSSVPAVAGSYIVTVTGECWFGAPDGLFISVCSGAEGGDSANIDASNALTACPTLVVDGGRGNPGGGGNFFNDISVTVDDTAIRNGQIAILAGELAAGSPWSAGTNLKVGGGIGNNERITVLQGPSYVASVVGASTIVFIEGDGWFGAPSGIFLAVCDEAEGGDWTSIEATDAPTACPNWFFENSPGVYYPSLSWPNRLSSDRISSDVWVTVDDDAIANGQVAILAGELVAGTQWLTGFNFPVGSLLSPDISIMLPQVDSDGDGANDFSGTRFDVGYNQASGLGADCASWSSVTGVYEIGNKGVASLVGVSPQDHIGRIYGKIALFHQPDRAGSDCRYTVSFPNRISAEAGTLVLRSGADRSVSYGTSASASYAVYVPPPPPQNNVGSSPSVGTPAGSGGGSGTGGGVGAGAGGSGSGGGGGGAGAGAGGGSAVATGPERQPVSVALRVPARTGQGYGSTESFRVRVFAPGACGGDTSLFGGMSARLGVTYSVRAVVGDQVVIGTGAAQTSPGATYTIPEYEQIGSQQVDCTLRIAEVSSPDGCALRTTTQDSTGTSYVEITEADNFETTLEYDCAVQETEREMSRGWTILRFNGQTGTTPATFAASLSNSVNSIWVWDPQTQGWNGWSASGRVATLAQLNQGDLVMAYVPRTRTIAYSPPDLLDPPAATGSLTLPPLYSVQMFGGQTTAKLSELLSDSVGVVPVIFRWNSQSQEWNYHLPGYGPVPSVSVPWFDEISPGDTVFIFNATGQATTIAWS